MNKVFCGACGIEINSYGHICEPMNSDYASFDRKLLLEIHAMLTDLVATDRKPTRSNSNPPTKPPTERKQSLNEL